MTFDLSESFPDMKYIQGSIFDELNNGYMQIYNQTCKKEIVDEGRFFKNFKTFPKFSRFSKFRIFGMDFHQLKPVKVVDKYQQLNEIYMKNKNLKRPISPGQVQF